MTLAKEQSDRRLLAILAADLVGYSHLVEVDEAAALQALSKLRRDVFDPNFAVHGGQLVKTMGDGVLVTFTSAVNALRCAVDMQVAMATRDDGLRLRVGVNVGDVVFEAGDILGDGVNIAARLESVAEPGGVAISGAVREHAGGRVAVPFVDYGEEHLKNIERTIRVWRWRPETVPATAPTPVPVTDKPSVAVLPFDNMTGDTSQDFIADGITETLTAALSHIGSFFVIARNSAAVFVGARTDVREVGRRLGVAYIVEGSVQRAGDRLRITVQLVETAAGAHVWSGTYDGAISDLFDLQDEITRQVAGSVQPSIRTAEMERSHRKRPQAMGAYDYTMQAFRHVWKLERWHARKGLELLARALEIDPYYPLALALTAWCHAQRSVYNWTDDMDATKAMALSHAEQAADLSPDDPLVLTVLGVVHTFARNFGAARVLLERAVALDPNAAWGWSRLGWLAAYANRSSEALAHFETSLRLSPVDPMNFNNYAGIASAHMIAGDDKKAAEFFVRVLDERPNAVWIHRNLAACLWHIGREDEARASFDKLREAYPDLTVEQFKRAMVFTEEVLEHTAVGLRALGMPER